MVWCTTVYFKICKHRAKYKQINRKVARGLCSLYVNYMFSRVMLAGFKEIDYLFGRVFGPYLINLSWHVVVMR